MHYPVMTERQLAARWKISLKTLRRWRSDNEGPTWHKLFQYVRYHEADILGFERQSAQHWSEILSDGERVPKVVTRPQEQPETEEDAGGCCHVKFLWPERPGARRYSGETGRNFPCIESFEAMVANCVCGSATRWNRETIAGR